LLEVIISLKVSARVSSDEPGLSRVNVIVGLVKTDLLLILPLLLLFVGDVIEFEFGYKLSADDDVEALIRAGAGDVTLSIIPFAVLFLNFARKVILIN